MIRIKRILYFLSHKITFEIKRIIIECILDFENLPRLYLKCIDFSPILGSGSFCDVYDIKDTNRCKSKLILLPKSSNQVVKSTVSIQIAGDPGVWAPPVSILGSQ